VEASLTEADLGGANLGQADLRWADFRGAKLHSTVCMDTVFADVDLSEARGLDSVTHRGPSTAGIDSVFRCEGEIPEAFLRGCGVPEALIGYLPHVFDAMQPIQFYSCFICHSSKDKAFSDRLHSRMLQAKLRVWYAPEDARGGRKNLDQIDEAIRVCDKLMIVLTSASMKNDWVRHEIGRAVEREQRENRQVLFPIGVASRRAIKGWSAFDSDSGKDVAKVVREYHIPDFSNWKDHDSFEEALARLLNDLEASEPTQHGAAARPAGPPEAME
jgi:hypothetical protein